jgi:hypothetical protein
VGDILAKATPGLGRLAMAISGGGEGAYQKEYDNTLKLQSALAQALAASRLHNLQADEVQGQLDARKPDAVLSSALLTNGIPSNEAGAVGDYLKTGQLGGKYRAPGDGMGPVAPAPDWLDKLGAVARSVGTVQGALTVGDKSIDSVAKAEAVRRGGQLSDQIIAGRADPTRVAQAEYAVSGKAPYDFKEFGTGNNLTGTVDDQGGPAVRFGQYRQAETGNAQAGARAHDASTVASLAAAEQHRAGTAEARARTNEITNGPKGVLVQTDNGPVFADPRSGKSVPVQNSDGTPAAPKLKDIPPAQNHAFVENAKGIMNIDDAMEAITRATGVRLDENGNPVRDPNVKPQSPDALGWRNSVVPTGVRQYTDPTGVTVRAKVANIGSQKMHDVSGANVTVSESPRIVPFVPLPTDGPGPALQKLANLRREYQNVNDMLTQTYSREQGFKPSAGTRPSGQGKGGVVDFHAMPTAAGGAREINYSDLKK